VNDKMRRTRNDHEVKTYVDERTYLLACKLAAKCDRTLSDFLRHAIRFYTLGCSYELDSQSPGETREDWVRSRTD
jgi:hypothetical protein